MQRGSLAILALLFGLIATCPAQDIDDLRLRLRSSLRDAHVMKSLGNLVVASEELELSGARFSFDDADRTRLSNFSLPLQRNWRAFGDDAPELYFESSIGFARAKQRTSDLYAGLAPGLETEVESDWTTFGALVGAGLRYELTETCAFTPIVNLALSHIDNDTDYGGPGANLTRAIADGLAFNWEALLWGVGGAARFDWAQNFGDDHELRLVARYDLRWIGVLDDDDPAQDFTSRSQILTLRGDLVGPTGLDFEGPIQWRATLGYRRFLEGQLFGANELVQLGGAIEVDVHESLPVGRALTFSASAFFGDDVRGFSVGVSLTF